MTNEKKKKEIKKKRRRRCFSIPSASRFSRTFLKELFPVEAALFDAFVACAVEGIGNGRGERWVCVS